ncbi:hypothetical protein HY573_00220 [Candidatus Parcubacteria bacterium]|nr:hypothetical protein [Candidatus Parcubacteria bacterium]
MSEQVLPIATKDDWDQCTHWLKRLGASSQPWPKTGAATYEALARLLPNPAVETVIYRFGPSHEELQVLLMRRPTKAEQPSEAFPGLLHSPGTVIRTVDAIPLSNDVAARIAREDLEAAFKRLEAKELAPAKFVGSPQLVAVRLIPDPARGVFCCLIHLAHIEGTPAKGEFYPANPLPDDLVPSHRIIIPTALKALSLATA